MLYYFSSPNIAYTLLYLKVLQPNTIYFLKPSYFSLVEEGWWVGVLASTR